MRLSVHRVSGGSSGVPGVFCTPYVYSINAYSPTQQRTVCDVILLHLHAMVTPSSYRVNLCMLMVYALNAQTLLVKFLCARLNSTALATNARARAPTTYECILIVEKGNIRKFVRIFLTLMARRSSTTDVFKKY